MKNTKTEVRFFTITEWEKEQDYLRQQHQKGWKFVRVNFIGLYHFEKCEPEDVIYLAVKGMLPNNSLGRSAFSRLIFGRSYRIRFCKSPQSCNIKPVTGKWPC